MKMKTTQNSLTTVGLVVTVVLLLFGFSTPAAQFEDATVSAGLINENGYCCAGAWGDYNNDGYIDLYIPIGAEAAQINALYRNNGNGSFTPVGSEAGPITSDRHDSQGATSIDFDNDGYLDMFVNNCWLTPSRNDLYWSNGDGTFRAGDAGDLTRLSKVRSWTACADYDRDGWVDLYLAEGDSWSSPIATRLYHATGTGTFESVDIGPTVNTANGACWGDYDNDGDPDLFVCNMTAPSLLWRNDGGGQFTAVNNGLPSNAETTHAAWADYDRDGDLDVALSSFSGTRIYRNDGTNGFALVTTLAGAIACPAWADYDNDGHVDLVAAIGQNSPKKAVLCHNNGNGTFSQVNDVFTSAADYWMGSSWGDFDNDGFMDVFFAHQYGANRLYRNLRNSNHWVKFNLVGTASNRDAIGAKVRIQATIDGQAVWQMQEVNGGYMPQNDKRLNFGLGDATNVDWVRVEWPSGNVEELQNIAAGQIVPITESRRPLLALSVTPPGMTGTLRGERNRIYQVVASEDLSNWTVLTSITNDASGTALWSDPAPTTQGRRFYKALMTP